jgi:hypothetical protein
VPTAWVDDYELALADLIDADGGDTTPRDL